MRTGLIAQKLGMSRVLMEDGEHVPVTLLKVDNCQVTDVRTHEKNGYTAVQLGSGTCKLKNVTKPLRGHFAKNNIEPKRKVVEFRVSEEALLKIGDEISINHFVAGQYVDIVGISIGKGFAGVMKRHNFSGHRASHGASLTHRTQGSTGSNQDPGKVWKNKRMAGHMGSSRTTTQNLTLHEVNQELNLLVIKGAVPGSKGSYVLIKDSVKLKSKQNLPFPAQLSNKSKSFNIDLTNTNEITSIKESEDDNHS